ncbi:MAG TPA: hypothetical protein VMM82_05725, partial [Spirochaetia bacterium]|nr:hypothetical protein [Spirochaetia bacterium]
MSGSQGSGSLRMEVSPRRGFADGRALRLLPALSREHPAVHAIRIVDVYIVENAPSLRLEDVRDVISDTVAQEVRQAGPAGETPQSDLPGWDLIIEITTKPGVTDPVAATALQALHAFLPGVVPAQARVQTATQYQVSVRQSVSSPDAAQLASSFHNPLIQSAFVMTRAQWEAGTRPPCSYPRVADAEPPQVRTVDL